MFPQLRDAALKQTKALPASATNAVTDGFQVSVTGYNHDWNTRAELYIEAPALTTGELPDAQTMTYIVEHATDAAFTIPVSLYGTVLTQTGAGGNGAAAATKRIALPSDVYAFVRVKATKSGSGSAATKSVAASLLF